MERNSKRQIIHSFIRSTNHPVSPAARPARWQRGEYYLVEEVSQQTDRVERRVRVRTLRQAERLMRDGEASGLDVHVHVARDAEAQG